MVERSSRRGTTLDRLLAWSGADAPCPSSTGRSASDGMIDAGAKREEVYAEAVRETQATYLKETVT